LNRAVAVAKVHGPAMALAGIESLESNPKLGDYHLLLAVRGHFFEELGRPGEAAACFRAALECPCSEPERRFLRRKLEETEGWKRSPAGTPDKISSHARPSAY
jgi:RNA polymerase sigma-70 factor (ECF subfamily)